MAVKTNWETIAEWKAWHPSEVAIRLRDAGIPWCIAGGWSLDIWRGQETRPHEDTEIAIPRTCFSTIRSHLSEFRLFAVGNGDVIPLPPETQPPTDKHQVWVQDEAAHAWRLDIFLEPGDAETWVFRRNELIRAPRTKIVAISQDGIPYLKPEAALLFKAAKRPKDILDFESSLPLMDIAARDWLRDALMRAHPEHEWLEKLT